MEISLHFLDVWQRYRFIVFSLMYDTIVIYHTGIRKHFFGNNAWFNGHHLVEVREGIPAGISAILLIILFFGACWYLSGTEGLFTLIAITMLFRKSGATAVFYDFIRPS